MRGLRVLGLDLGTTALKAIVSDGVSKVYASAQAPITTSRPQALWSEQNPHDWWQACRKACAALKRQAPEHWSRIQSISLSGQMHGVVLLKNAAPLRPCILHNDGRAFVEAAQLNQDHPRFAGLAGVRAMAGFGAPKLKWLQKHEPRLLEQADMLLAPKDYLRFRLTGEFATDPVDASGLWLLDVERRQLSDEICNAVGLAPSQRPPVCEANANAGKLHKDAARALALPASINVITGTGDAAANALGLGLINDGDGVVSLGTAAQILVSRNLHQPLPQQNIHAFAHGLPSTWFQMAALLNGASPLAWIAQRLLEPDIPKLLASVNKRMHQPSHLLFLPYLAGERTPHDNPQARGVFHGLDHLTERSDLTRAVLEGVALSLADCHDILAKADAAPKILYGVGGGFKSQLWAEIIASALGRNIHTLEASDYGGALGAARLARQGLTQEAVSDIFIKPKRTRLVKPNPVWAERYQKSLPKFRALYQAIKAV